MTHPLMHGNDCPVNFNNDLYSPCTCGLNEFRRKFYLAGYWIVGVCVTVIIICSVYGG